MTAVRAGQRVWRIHEWTGPDLVARFIVFRCIVARVLPGHRVLVQPNTMTTIRVDVPAADVFTDEDAARTEARRRRAATRLGR